MSSRRRAPVLEALESRELLMGFSMNPVVTTLVFDLAGTARGSVRLAGTAEVVNASGVITPLGSTQVTGTLNVVGGAESGVLKLNSSSAHLQLFVYGAVGKPLHFAVSGTTSAPRTIVYGSGLLTVHLGPGPKGPDIAMEFIG